MLLPALLGCCTLLLSAIIALLGLAGFFFPIHMATAVGWEALTGQRVDQSARWYVGVSVATTLSLSLGPAAWIAARAWGDGRAAVLVSAGLAAHVAVALVMGRTSRSRTRPR